MRFIQMNLRTIQKRAIAAVSMKSLLTLVMVSFVAFYQSSSAAQDNAATERFQKNQLARLAFAQESKESGEASKSLRKGRDLIEDEKWQEAEESFKDFIADYPQHKNVDAALYWMAFSLKKQGRLQDADRTLNQLIKEHPKSSWSDDAQALRLEMAPQLGNQTTIEKALDESKDSGNDEMKMIALQSLMYSNPERAMPILQDILKSDSKANRTLKHTAVALLGQSGNAQAINLLMDVARNQSEPEIVNTVIFWLGMSGDERAFDYLKEVVTTGKDKSRVSVALTGIAQSRNPRARAFLLETARSATSVEARQAAIVQLALFGGEQSIDELTSLYDSESNTEIKKQVLIALGMIGNPRVQAKLLEIARNETDIEVRKTAVFWFAQQGGEKAVDTLISMYDSEQNTEIKDQLIFAMAQSGSKRAVQKLIEIAKNSSSLELRKKAIFWLGQSSAPEARKFLEDLVK